jgi:hypothetical protein
MKTNIHFWPYLTHFSQEWKMFRTKLVQEIKTHILCSVTFLVKISAIFEIMWKKIVEWGRRQITKWRMRIALTICNTYCFFHLNKSCNNTSQFHIIRTLPVSLELPFSFSVSILVQQMKHEPLQLRYMSLLH